MLRSHPSQQQSSQHDSYQNSRIGQVHVGLHPLVGRERVVSVTDLYISLCSQRGVISLH